MYIFLQRLFNKIHSIWVKNYFKEKTSCICNGLSIIGPLYLINKNVTCGSNLTLYPNVMIFGDGPVVIGNNVDIGNGTVLYSSKNGGGIRIGDNTVIAAQCYIIDMDHGINRNTSISEQPNEVSPIYIGKDVWIAAGCKILKGSVINDGAVIGAMSLVKGEIESNGIAYGIPAKIKKYRE